VILYLDTSALVKLYVEEPGSPAVSGRVDQAAAVTTSRVTYAEARAAFARSRRDGVLSADGLRHVVRALDEEWTTYSVVDVTDFLVRRAGTLAERHALRAYDAVQLSAALTVRSEIDDVEFATFDVRLTGAARREGLRVSPLS
jgi:predicted nucleic acid-binding protein